MALVAVVVATGLAAAVYLLVRREWSYAPDAQTDRIVRLLDERRSQPAADSLGSLADHLASRGVECSNYAEHATEYLFAPPDPAAYATCEVEGQTVTLWRYGSSWDKFQHREAIAGCEESDPYRPNYWVDGDNWVVVTSSNPAARSIARALGAALYRACAAPAGVTTTTFPMRTGATGSPVEFSYPAFTERFTVTSVADPYSFPDGRAPAAGHRFVAVDLTYERESSQPFGDSYEPFRIWNDLVVHDSGIRESVYPSPAVKAIETDEMRALPGELKGSTSVTLVFEIPDSWRDPVLHASMVEDGWILGHWRLA